MAKAATAPAGLPGQPLAEIQDHLKVLYYGPPGSGKTTNLAHLAHLGPVVFINAEGGVKQAPLRKLGVPVENIRVVPAESYDQLDDLWQTLRGALDDDPSCIAGVCWDSVSEIVSKFVGQARQAGYEKVKAKAHSMGVEPERTRFFTDRDDWGEESGQVKDLLMKYRDLPCHFGVSALPRRDVDDDSTVHYAPAVNPAVLTDLMGRMDIVGWTENVIDDTDSEVFTGLFRAGMIKEVKDRYKVLPRVLFDPTFDRLIDYVYEKIDAESDPVQQEHTGHGGDAEDSEDKKPGQRAPLRRAARRPAPTPDTTEANDTGGE